MTSAPKRKSLDGLLWRSATRLQVESWGDHEPEYPGHDPGSPAHREFRGLRIGERVLILLDEEGVQGSKTENRSIVRNLKYCRAEIQKALAIESFDGWVKSGRVPSSLPDKQSVLAKSLEDFFSPLQGSEADATSLARLIASWEGSLSYIKIDGSNASVSAIAGKRVSVTGGRFIYDEAVVALLQQLKFDVAHRSVIAANAIPQEMIDAFWKASDEDWRRIKIEHLQQQIRETQQQLKTLKKHLKIELTK
jgi:hypothetical protein